MTHTYSLTADVGDSNPIDIVVTFTVTPGRPAALNAPAEEPAVEIDTVRDAAGRALSDLHEDAVIEILTSREHERAMIAVANADEADWRAEAADRRHDFAMDV